MHLSACVPTRPVLSIERVHSAIASHLEQERPVVDCAPMPNLLLRLIRVEPRDLKHAVDGWPGAMVLQYQREHWHLRVKTALC